MKTAKLIGRTGRTKTMKVSKRLRRKKSGKGKGEGKNTDEDNINNISETKSCKRQDIEQDEDTKRTMKAMLIHFE